MTMKNEPFLQRIRELEEDKGKLNERIRQLEEEISSRELHLGLAVAEINFIYNQIGSERASGILTRWKNSVSRKSTLTAYDVKRRLEDIKEISGECRSLEEHKERQHIITIFEED